MISTGTFNITLGNATVVGNAAARTAILGLPANFGTTAAQIQKLQIRFMNLPTSTATVVGQASQVYDILVAQDTSPTYTLTLDRPVQEPTNAIAPFLLYRAYITVPDANFLTWDALVDMVNGFRITGDKLTYTSTWFDVRDPQRQSLGQALYCGLYKGNPASPTYANPIDPASGPLVYELWPHPTQGQTFYARYRSKGADLVNPTDSQPPSIPDELLIGLATYHYVIPYCQANIGHFPAMAKVNWRALSEQWRVTLYGSPAQGIRGVVRDATIQGENAALQTIYARGHGLKSNMPRGFYGPVDSAWIQSHGTPW